MKIPFSYIFRNLWTRKLTTLLTAGGMALVVFVFSAVLMLDAGLKRTMVGTGSVDNVVFIRKGAETEIQSGITRDQAALIESQPQVAHSVAGQPMASKESLVLISLTKKGQDKGSNIVTRGLSPIGFDRFVAPLIGKRLDLGGIPPAHGLQYRPIGYVKKLIHLPIRIGMRSAHKAVADHADVERFGHR